MAMFPHGIWKKSRLMECCAGAREVFMLVYGMLDPWGVMVYSRRAIVASWCKDDDAEPPMTDAQLKNALEELEQHGLIDFYEEDGVRYICSFWHENNPSTKPKHPLPPWIKADAYTVGKNGKARWARSIDADAWSKWRAAKMQQKDKPRTPAKEAEAHTAAPPAEAWPPDEECVAQHLCDRYPERYKHWFLDEDSDGRCMAREFLAECKKQGTELHPDTWQAALVEFAERQHRVLDEV